MRQFGIMFICSLFGAVMGGGTYIEIFERPEEFRIQIIFCSLSLIGLSIFFTRMLEESKPE